MTTLVDLQAAARVQREARAAERTWLYFIQAGTDGPVKIGLATDPADRLSTLQTGNPEELRLLAVYRCFPFEERDVHQELEAHRVRGEWFAPHPDVLALAEALDAPFVVKEMVA